MSDSVTVTGMVLNAMPMGDYDKRITLLTADRGKITAFARGARRPNSALLAPTSPFAFGEFELIEGKTAYSLKKASISSYFRELTEDPQAVYLGFYFLEFMSYFCQENTDEKEMLRLLYRSLHVLLAKKIPVRLLRVVFELKALQLSGIGPAVFSCMGCGRKELDAGAFYSVKKGGLLCPACGQPSGGFPVSSDCRYALQYIFSSEIRKLYSFLVNDRVLAELEEVCRLHMARFANHHFKSLDIYMSTLDSTPGKQ